MFKKILKGIVIGGAALTIAASAQAGTINVNLYGASAQFEFWTATAPDFLISQGCGTADVGSAKAKLAGRDVGIAVCRGVDAIQGVTGNGIGTAKDTVVIRYTSEASYDGVRAVTEDPNYTTECGDGALRKQANAETSTFPAHPGVGVVGGALICQDVHIGASDVAATTFGQYSEGNKLGHVPSDYIYQSIFFPADLQDPGPEGLNYQVDRPIVVPFGFFAHTSVPFDNMSRLMATSIYSGQVMNWNEFNPAAGSLPLVACLRHAGSGTAATLDAAVMRGDANLLQVEALPGSELVTLEIQPVTYFNNGSSDEMKCVGENAGAVGYADADKCVKAGSCLSTVKTMTYQGVAPSSTAIKNGQYDFWAAQWLYSNEPAGATDDMIDALVAFASIDANLPASKKPYWAAQTAMKWAKDNDFLYPVQK
jgi:hypothetical protein